MDVEKAVAQYAERSQLYERFTLRMRTLIEELLNSRGFQFTLEHRTKEAAKFREKITRPGKSYSDPLHEVTDLCGLRIILRRLSDLEGVVATLRSEFAVDELNSVYKAKELNVDQFGYTSVHLVVSTHPNRLVLTEWRVFTDLKAEIQVRTILQHAWATISRSFDYRVGADIPREFRRRLFRLSALFELADEELDKVAEDIKHTIESYRVSLSTGSKTIELNVDSLRTYLETSPEVHYWNEYLRTHTGQQVDETWGDLSRDLRIASFCGLTNLEQINTILTQARGWGERFFSEYFEEFFQRNNVTPDKVSTVRNGTLTMLLIATYVDRFTPEILDKEFGFGTTYILDVTRQVRGKTP